MPPTYDLDIYPIFERKTLHCHNFKHLGNFDICENNDYHIMDVCRKRHKKGDL